jgi:hypothetical protein
MKMQNQDDQFVAADSVPESDDLPSREEDPELEREFQELAGWLLEAYRYRQRKQHEADGG